MSKQFEIELEARLMDWVYEWDSDHKSPLLAIEIKSLTRYLTVFLVEFIDDYED